MNWQNYILRPKEIKPVNDKREIPSYSSAMDKCSLRACRMLRSGLNLLGITGGKFSTPPAQAPTLEKEIGKFKEKSGIRKDK